LHDLRGFGQVLGAVRRHEKEYLLRCKRTAPALQPSTQCVPLCLVSSPGM
jgi:hypothetical protein